MSGVFRSQCLCDVSRHNAVGWMSWGIMCVLIGCDQPQTTTQSSIQESQPPSRMGVLPPALQDEATPPIVRWVQVPQLSRDIAIMDSVFWEPEDTTSTREAIESDPRIKGSQVLEIGTGSGLLSLCCLESDAARVVATDINPVAVHNALENARILELDSRLEVRLVPRRDPDAWTVIQPNERFDLIISNPPWEDATPESVEKFALYDPGFRLLDSLISGAKDHLNPDGRMWLAYGCVTAIRRIQSQAAEAGLNCKLKDERSLDNLPELFLPGMLIELTVPKRELSAVAN